MVEGLYSTTMVISPAFLLKIDEAIFRPRRCSVRYSAPLQLGVAARARPSR